MLFPPYLLPHFGWFKALWAQPEAAVLRLGTFERQSQLSRYYIAGPNGLQTLTVPVQFAEKSMRTFEHIAISYAEPWQRIHLKSLDTAYRKAPFYLYYADELHAIINTRHTLLIELNKSLLEWLMSCLGGSGTLPFARISTQNQKINPPYDHFSSILPPVYEQVFPCEYNPSKPMSILDLLFNLGPETALLF